jgi:hypothetical protein
MERLRVSPSRCMPCMGMVMMKVAGSLHEVLE